MHVARNKAIGIVICFLIACTLSSCKDGQFTELNLGGGKADLNWEALVANAKIAKDKGNVAGAEEMYKEAAEKCAKAYGENDGRTATCVGYLAELYFSKQEWRVAYETYKRWIKILQEIDPSGDNLKHAKENYKKVKEKLKQYGLADEIKKEQKEKKEKEQKEQEDKELQEQEEKLNEDVPKGRKRRVRGEDALPSDSE
jgi:tetratricopeptide (TPR) repeat protein